MNFYHFLLFLPFESFEARDVVLTKLLGPFSTRDNRVLKEPLGRSLRSFARSAALRFAMFATLARSVHGLAHSLRSLPHGMVEIH